MARWWRSARSRPWWCSWRRGNAHACHCGELDPPTRDCKPRPFAGCMAAHRGVARGRVQDVKLRANGGKEGAQPGDGGAERVRSRWESGIVAVTTGIVAAALRASDTQHRPQARLPGCLVPETGLLPDPLPAPTACCACPPRRPSWCCSPLWLCWPRSRAWCVTPSSSCLFVSFLN